MGSHDEPRRSQFQPMNLPNAGGRASGPRQDNAARDGDNGRPAPTPPSGPARFGSPGNQFRPLPKYGAASKDAPARNTPPPPSRSRRDDRLDARHAPPDDSFPGYDESASFAAPSRSRGSSRSRSGGWDDEPARSRGGKRDPWDRDWSQWSVSDHADDFEEEFARSDEWERWNRSAWGMGPDAGTMASVAVVVQPRYGARKSGKGGAWAELGQWAKAGFARTATPSKKAVRLLVVVSILGTIFLSGMGMALAAYADYASVKGLADNGKTAFLHVGEDLGLGNKALKGQKVDQAHQNMAMGDLNLALSDFQQLHDKLTHPDFILTMAGSIPKIRDMLQSGLVLSNVAISAVQLAQYLFPALLVIADVVNASPISTASSSADAGDLLSLTDFATLSVALKDQRTQDTLHTMISEIESVPPSVLVSALSTKQQKDILPLLQLAPQIPNALSVLYDFMPVLPSLLGIGRSDGQPVGYLLMTLDHSEIRPVGGFQGQYAVFGVQGGRIGHIALTDVYKTLEPFQNLHGTGNQTLDYPNLYIPSEANWWYPTGLGWAMRNSGLSQDFNQDARNALWYLHNETTCVQKPGFTRPVCVCDGGYLQSITALQCIAGGDHIPITDSSGKITGYQKATAHMGGVIMIQQTIIAQLLSVIGPINIGCPYNVSVNATNLETYIHKFQETNAGRAQGNNSCGSQLSDATKRFTAMIAQALQDKVKSVPKGELLTFAGDLLQDLHTGDIRIYLSDPDKSVYNNTPYAINTPDKLYPENKAAMALLRQYHISSDMYGTVDQKGNPMYYSVPGEYDDSLAVNRADVVGWKLEDYVSVKIVDNIELDKHGNAKHNMTLQYTFNIPQPVVDKNTDLSEALFNVVYNAANNTQYQEEVRFYVNPNDTLTQLQGLSAPFPTSDVPNRDVFGGVFNYYANENQATNTVTWDTQFNTTTNNLNPSISASWFVQNVVNKGVYNFHLERQSGVTTSYDITVTSACSSTPLIQQQGDLTVNLLFTANVPTC